MALTRSALREKGVTDKEVLDYIMEEHGNTVEATKEKAKETAEAAAKITIDGLQSKVDSMQTIIDETPKPEDAGKYDTLKAEFDTYKSTIEADKKTAAITAIAEKKLLESGCNPKAAKFILKELPLDKLKDDGSNWDEIHNPIKEANADFYGKVQQQGADVGGGLQGGGELNPFTKDHFDLQAQTNLFRKNPTLAREMAAAAGIKLPE